MESAPLLDRIKALAAEANEQVDAVQARRASLAGERDAEVAAIRQRHQEEAAREVEEVRSRFSTRVAEIDAELATLKRLRTALVPHDPAPRKPPQRKRRSKSSAHEWKASDELRRAVLAAMAEGHERVREIVEATTFSQASVRNAIDDLRALGFVRLAGETRINGRNMAKLYRVTPQGMDFLTANETNGSVEVVANA